MGQSLSVKLKAKLTARAQAKRDPAQLSPPARAYFEIVEALTSGNAQSRRMAILFFTSAAGVLLVFALTVHRIVVRVRIAQAESARVERIRLHHEALLTRQAEEAKDQLRWAQLGLYSVEVYPDVEHDSGLKNRVDIEFDARCVDRATREFLDARQTQVRSEISNVLIGLQRDDLLSPIGKYRLKKKIAERLNRWIYGEYPKGRIEEIFISNLSIK